MDFERPVLMSVGMARSGNSRRLQHPTEPGAMTANKDDERGDDHHPRFLNRVYQQGVALCNRLHPHQQFSLGYWKRGRPTRRMWFLLFWILIMIPYTWVVCQNYREGYEEQRWFFTRRYLGIGLPVGVFMEAAVNQFWG